ncbi:MAG: stage V sporulation protein S [Tepidibacillus sp.]
MPISEDMKISKNTHPKKIAGAVYNALQAEDEISCIAIGHAANGNLTKAFIIAKGYFLQHGQKVIFDPNFTETEVPDKGEVVAFRWIVKRIG